MRTLLGFVAAFPIGFFVGTYAAATPIGERLAYELFPQTRKKRLEEIEEERDNWKNWEEEYSRQHH